MSGFAGERCAWARRRPEGLWAGAAIGRVNRGPYAGPADRAGTGAARVCARWAPCSSRLAPWWLPKVPEAVDPQPRGPLLPAAGRRFDSLGVLRAPGDRTGPASTPHARPGRPGDPARRRRALEEVKTVSTDARSASGVLSRLMLDAVASPDA